MTTTTEPAAPYQDLVAYRLIPGERLVDQSPFLVLNCPHGLDHVVHNGPACLTNLFDRQQRTGPVELVALMTAALFHDDPGPSLERTRRYGQLRRYLGELGAYTLSVDIDDHPFLVLNCPYRGGRCPGSEDGECTANLIPADQAPVDLGTVLQLATAHEQARYGVPVERLAALRHWWAERRKAEVYVRETGDGPSAFGASVRADLYGRLLAELDRAVNGA